MATSDVIYHSPERRLLQDVVSCIREKCTVDTLGRRRERFADRHLKPADEMERLFSRYLGDIPPVWRSVEIARACSFDLGQFTYTYPDEVGDGRTSAQSELERLTWLKVPDRYPDGLPDKVRAQLDHELRLIRELAYAPYFLTVHSIVAFARSKGILCQGRGSAANSAVCFVLGITSIDPVKSELLFEHFVSAERREPPDIDVDFEHDRREEVIQWIYDTYGRDHSALTAVVTRFRAKGAIREVGKALGVTEDVLGGLSSQIWGWSREGVEERHAEEINLDLTDRRLFLTIELARLLIDTPRHTSQHPGGFVLTLGRLDELVPIESAAMENRQIIEWDKDDIDALGFMKVDVLALGMLGCMRRAFEFLAEDKGIALDLATAFTCGVVRAGRPALRSGSPQEPMCVMPIALPTPLPTSRIRSIPFAATVLSLVLTGCTDAPRSRQELERQARHEVNRSISAQGAYSRMKSNLSGNITWCHVVFQDLVQKNWIFVYYNGRVVLDDDPRFDVMARQCYATTRE